MEVRNIQLRYIMFWF